MTTTHDAGKSAFLANLPEDLEYTGEFGPELVLALPFFNWLSQAGLLKSRRIVTYKGMRVFYEDLGCREIVEKEGKREYIHPRRRPAFLPRKSEHDFDGRGRSNLHVWPDLRARFQKFPLLPDICAEGRPLLIVHNKYCNEWNRGPINFMSVALLRSIFQTLSPHFTIVYIRHGIRATEGYVEDENQLMQIDDLPLIEQYDNVRLFDDLYDEHKRSGGDQDLNTFKNVLYSRCFHFLSSQGGGAHQIALYSGSLMTVLHRRGSEEKWAYSDGYYNFMARVPPILAVGRHDQDILDALPLYLGTSVLNDRVYPASGAASILERLSPKRLVPPPAGSPAGRGPGDRALTLDQMLARRVEDAASLFLVESAVRNRLPFSFVRMNDGEAYIIGARRGVPDEEVAWILHHWWGWKEVDFAFVEWLRAQLLDVAASTDLLGFFDRCDSKHSRFTRMGMLLREHANLDAVKAFVSPEAALQWHDADQLERILHGQPSVKLVCAYDISAGFAAKFEVGSVEWIPIPGHAKYSDQIRWSYSHAHRRFAEIDAYLKTIAKDAIVLVGAGVLGKLYCKTVKEHGGIALDLGSVFDSWAENMRRPSARSRRKGL